MQVGVLGSDCAIVQTGRDRMSQRDLPVLVLQDITRSALDDTRPAAREPSGMIAETCAATACLDAHHSHTRIAKEFVEQPDRVAPASNAGNKQVRQSLFRVEYLCASFAADY